MKPSGTSLAVFLIIVAVHVGQWWAGPEPVASEIAFTSATDDFAAGQLEAGLNPVHGSAPLLPMLAAVFVDPGPDVLQVGRVICLSLFIIVLAAATSGIAQEVSLDASIVAGPLIGLGAGFFHAGVRFDPTAPVLLVVILLVRLLQHARRCSPWISGIAVGALISIAIALDPVMIGLLFWILVMPFLSIRAGKVGTSKLPQESIMAGVMLLVCGITLYPFHLALHANYGGFYGAWFMLPTMHTLTRLAWPGLWGLFIPILLLLLRHHRSFEEDERSLSPRVRLTGAVCLFMASFLRSHDSGFVIGVSAASLLLIPEASRVILAKIMSGKSPIEEKRRYRLVRGTIGVLLSAAMLNSGLIWLSNPEAEAGRWMASNQSPQDVMVTNVPVAAWFAGIPSVRLPGATSAEQIFAIAHAVEAPIVIVTGDVPERLTTPKEFGYGVVKAFGRTFVGSRVFVYHRIPSAVPK